jgi:hypothetical protein
MTSRTTSCMAAVLLLFLSIAAPANSRRGPEWESLRFFDGRWDGVSQGKPGNGTVARSYRFGVGGTFLVANNCSIYPKQKSNPNGEVHVDHALIGFDKMRTKFVMRQFHVEGFVNQYVLDDASPNAKTFVWTTESIENIPEGWQARETYVIRNDTEFTETFELREPGKTFELYSRTEFKKSATSRLPQGCQF